MIAIILATLVWTMPLTFSKDFGGKWVTLQMSVDGGTWVDSNIRFQVPAGVYVRFKADD